MAEAIAGTDAETLIVADADVWCDGLQAAVEAVDETGWAVPHSHVHRLTPEATSDLLAGGGYGNLEEKPYRGVAGGGIVVVTRSTWQQVPMDPRFEGWGAEDEAWGLALRRLIGHPFKQTGPLWHLWHPPQARKSRGIGSDANVALYRRYSRAYRNPEQLRALVEEVRM